MKRGRRAWFLPAAWILSSTLLFVLVLQYKYLYSDQVVYFIHPFRELYPAFALNDWFTWSVRHWHVGFSNFVVLYSLILGPEVGSFTMFVLMVGLFCIVSWRFVILYGGGALHYGVFLGLLLFGRNIGLGASRILPTDGVLVPMDLVMPFVLFTFYFVIRERYALAGLCAGVAGYFHVNAMVLLGLVFGTYFVINVSKLVRGRGYMFGLGYVAIGWPTIHSVVRDFGRDADASPEVFSQLFPFLWFHVSAHLWGPSIFAFAVMCQLLIWRWHGERRGENERRLLMLSLIIGGWLAVAYIASQPWSYSLFVVRLFLWRFDAVVMYFAYLVLSLWFVRAVRTVRTGHMMEAAVIGLMVFTVFVARDDFPLSGVLAAFMCTYLLVGGGVVHGPGVTIGLSVASVMGGPIVLGTDVKQILAAVLATSGIGGLVWLSGAENDMGRLVRAAGPAAFLMICLLALWPFDASARPRLPAVYVRDEAAYEELTRWARRETRAGDVFLINPERRGFVVRTHRAIFVDLKNAPARGDEIKEWLRRLFEVYGVEDVTALQEARFANVEPEHLKDVARRHHVQYIVFEGDAERMRQKTSRDAVFRNAVFYVVRASER